VRVTIKNNIGARKRHIGFMDSQKTRPLSFQHYNGFEVIRHLDEDSILGG
jgi:hypothetical protein